MRCRKHYPTGDYSSSVGVCASCLRLRLLSLIAAQSHSQPLSSPTPSSSADRRRKPDHHHHHPPHPPPRVIFPHSSLSPFIGTSAATNDDGDDQSTASDSNHHAAHSRSVSDPRFFSTPLVGPGGANKEKEQGRRRRRKSTFGLISSLFRSGSRKCGPSDPDPDQDSRVSVPVPVSSNSPSSSSSSWISGLLVHRGGSGRRGKKSTTTTMASLFAAAEAAEEENFSAAAEGGGGGGKWRHRCHRDRGMSPNCDDEVWEDPLPEEYYSPEHESRQVKMTPMWKRTPSSAAVRPSQCRARQSPSRSGLAAGFGFGFCLSPLVRVGGPSRQWSNTPEINYSGEIRVPVKPHLAAAASFCANRSRKLADFGRVNLNR